MSKKKKKEKVKYIDDGRRIADMSAFGGGGSYSPRKKLTGRELKSRGITYLEAVKMMFGPMMVTITVLGLVFLIGWLLLFLFG
ncbi:MAG: hypothetical protein IJY65_05685 [Clostridia bacterium]|nr:hypothetical protein [Clostridia bacterium]